MWDNEISLLIIINSLGSSITALVSTFYNNQKNDFRQAGIWN